MGARGGGLNANDEGLAGGRGGDGVRIVEDTKLSKSSKAPLVLPSFVFEDPLISTCEEEKEEKLVSSKAVLVVC